MKHPCDYDHETPLRNLTVGDKLFRCFDYGSLNSMEFRQAVLAGKTPTIPVQEWEIVKDWVEVIPPVNKWDKVHRIRMIELKMENRSFKIPLHTAHHTLFITDKAARVHELEDIAKDGEKLRAQANAIRDFVRHCVVSGMTKK